MCLPSFVKQSVSGKDSNWSYPESYTQPPGPIAVAEEMAACDWLSLDHVLPLGELWLTILSETSVCPHRWYPVTKKNKDYFRRWIWKSEGSKLFSTCFPQVWVSIFLLEIFQLCETALSKCRSFRWLSHLTCSHSWALDCTSVISGQGPEEKGQAQMRGVCSGGKATTAALPRVPQVPGFQGAQFSTTLLYSTTYHNSRWWNFPFLSWFSSIFESVSAKAKQVCKIAHFNRKKKSLKENLNWKFF